MGFMEMLLLLLMLSPDGPYERPADAATVFRHVPDEAVLVVTADVASLGRGAKKEFKRILKKPLFNQSVLMQQAARAMRSGRALLEAQAGKFGIDPFSDIRYATLALGDGGGSEKILAVFGGKIPQKAFDALVAEVGATPQDGAFAVPGQGTLLARDADGSVLFGSVEWVRTAMAGKHRHPSWKRLLAGHDRSTYFMATFRPTDPILKEWKREMDILFHPLLIDGFSGASMRLTYRGSELRVAAPDARRAVVWGGILRGFGLVSVAGRDAAEGLLQMGESFFASLDAPPAPGSADAKAREIVRVLVAHRAEIRKLVARYFLGKRQKARVRVDKRRKVATLTISGRGLASMVFIPASLGAFLIRAEAPKPQPQLSAPATTPPVPTE